MISAVLEILIELSVRLVRFVIRNFRAVFSLFIGASFGLAIGVSLARYGGVNILVILMYAIISAVVIAPRVVAFLNKLSPPRR